MIVIAVGLELEKDLKATAGEGRHWKSNLVELYCEGIED